MQCYFCGFGDIRDIPKDEQLSSNPSSYTCPRCGHVRVIRKVAGLFVNDPQWTKEDKSIISIVLRNEYERRGRTPSQRSLAFEDLHRIVDQYRPLDALEKMDNALLNLERASKYVGHEIKVNLDHDFPLYHCFESKELRKVLWFLCQGRFINAEDDLNPHNGLFIAIKGYERLRELKRLGKDSRQCFVAMWLAPEMNEVYGQAIVPAIEYIVEDQTEPRFKALRIDNKEHTNDINDEIIAEIRRSRFMVCDLTGYRGGVYFEAGFAYGLGLEVIYTCREDWIEGEALKVADEKVVEKLKGVKSGNEIEIKKEGIHFDLEHRNRISWTEDDLEGFKEALRVRIQAVIV